MHKSQNVHYLPNGSTLSMEDGLKTGSCLCPTGSPATMCGEPTRYVSDTLTTELKSGTFFWGGNILKGKDNKYHLFVCGWPENSPKGHMTWPKSTVFHTTSEHLNGPYTICDTIGKGHNPEAFILKDGRPVVYVIDGYYIADSLNGPWTYSHFTFDKRNRKVIEGLSNLTFARRSDGSYLMVCRGGGVWISETVSLLISR